MKWYKLSDGALVNESMLLHLLEMAEKKEDYEICAALLEIIKGPEEYTMDSTD
jgi:hypothetical protein